MDTLNFQPPSPFGPRSFLLWWAELLFETKLQVTGKNVPDEKNMTRNDFCTDNCRRLRCSRCYGDVYWRAFSVFGNVLYFMLSFTNGVKDGYPIEYPSNAKPQMWETQIKCPEQAAVYKAVRTLFSRSLSH